MTVPMLPLESTGERGRTSKVIKILGAVYCAYFPRQSCQFGIACGKCFQPYFFSNLKVISPGM